MSDTATALADRLTGSGLEWSVRVRSVEGTDLLDVGPGKVLATASVGKLLLLIHLATQITAGEIDPREPLTRTRADHVTDSGLWQHLGAETLSLMDLCALVGSVSDNLATNVLLRRVGLAAVAEAAAGLGLRDVALHDRVRDRRSPADPPRLSSGTAAGLVAVMLELAAPRRLEHTAAGLVLGWLALNTDLSQVGAAFGLDPLAHLATDLGIQLRNKTGTDAGVRADTGLVRGPSGVVAYAAIANWPPSGPDRRRDVLSGLRDIGVLIAGEVGAG